MISSNSVLIAYIALEKLSKKKLRLAILQNLLDCYCTAILGKNQGHSSNFDSLVLKTIPEKYLNVEDTIYHKILNIACYVASLTDSKAVELNNKIRGAAL